MSPEQVKSEPTDARSDLYSLGVSLYEMVTGHRMFGATSSYSVMEAHVKEVPRPPIEVTPTLPKALSDIIMMAVAKDPAHRFQTAEAFRNALSQISGSATIPAAAAAVGVAAPVAYSPTPAPSQPAPMTPAPPPSVTPVGTPAPGGYATPQSQIVRGGRHVGWLLAVAILVLVAMFGGAQAYRSHKQNAVLDADVESGAKTTTATPMAAPTPQPMPPANPAPANSVQGQPAVATPAPGLNSAPTPQPHAPKAAQQQANLAPPPPDPNQPTPEEIAAQKKLIEDMENEMDQLGSRSAAVESSLDAMEQQMHQSGLGLRGDMVAARGNMRADLAKAKQSLDGGDTDHARKFLDQANHEIQKLEAFMGRR